MRDSNLVLQIEKFIESIFPSQKAEDAQRRVAGEVTAEEAEKRKQDAENKSDVYFLMAVMGSIVLIVAGIMVCLPLFLGSVLN